MKGTKRSNKKERSKLIAASVLFAGMLTGCALQELPKSIMQPVEEVVSTVKKNMELKHQMDALELPKDVESISREKYAYSTLSEDAQKIYDQMLDAILNHDKEVTLSTSDGEYLEDIFSCIKADYGGLFWVESFRYTQYQKNGQTQIMSFSPNYSMGNKKREKIQHKIDQKAKKYLDGIAQDATDYEKVRYIYKKLIQKVDYNLEAKNNQNIISVFLGRETVCQGYANAMQYLMEQLEIPCIVVTGKAKGGPHAWNLVKLDGEWYYVDVTWGNSRYHDDEQNDVKYVEYDYLNITTEEMSRDHQPQMKFKLPKCTSIANNYYVKEGKFFTAMDDTTIEVIGEKLRQAYKKGESNLSVKFSDSNLCAQAKKYFLTDYHINDYCSGVGTVYYKTDMQLNILMIIFP